MSQVIKHDYNDLSTPDTVGLKKLANSGLIVKLKKAVDNLNDKEYEMYNPSVHEVVAALLTIMNNGIDYSKMSSTTPLSTDDNRGFMSANMSQLYNRRSTKYVHELKFLKTEKMRSQIWLLLELSNGTLSELFNQLNLNEIQSRYTAQSAIRSFPYDIRDALESIESRNIKFTGQIIDRFHKYLESTIDLPCASDYDDSNPKTCAPIHKKKPGMDNLQTPDRFGSPTIIMDQFDFTLEPDVIEEKQLTPSIQFKDLKKDKLKNSYRLFRSNYESYVENYYYQQYSQAPRIVNLDKQNYKCQDCQKSIQMGIPLLRQKTAQLCHYSGYWFCKQCIHPTQTIIPSKVFQNFDFNKYQVNIQGYQDIQGILKIPMFQINYCQNMIYDNHSLYDFLILRRELHLMYDRFCDPIVFQELSQLKRQMYFVIQIPLLSLDDLQGIKNGSLLSFVLERKKVLVQHVKQCFNCQKYGQICSQCQSKDKIFCYDIKNTQYCKKCFKLFHRECFNKCCQ